MTVFTLQGAQVLLPEGLAPIALTVEAGRIAAIDGPAKGRILDARGLILAPAMVDVHGDAFERQIMPRPGVFFPLEAALFETDAALAAHGIATAYHALTLSWEPGLRSVEQGAAIMAALRRLRPRLAVEHRLQLRWETFCFEALPLMAEALADPLAPALAFNDHTSMAMLAPEVDLQTRPFEQDPAFPLADPDHPAFRAKMAERAKRAGLTAEAYARRLTEVWARRPRVPEVVAQVAALAQGHPMLSHDDSQPETRAHYRALGARIAEFPMARAAAEAARAAGDLIVFGAPNAARGGSHLGSLGAGEMIRAGLCDILASDYAYPALLSAVARLRGEGLALERLWPLVSAHPAAAMGLTDRGTIAPGQRADLVAIDWPATETPRIVLTLVEGRIAHQTRGAPAF